MVDEIVEKVGENGVFWKKILSLRVFFDKNVEFRCELGVFRYRE